MSNQLLEQCQRHFPGLAWENYSGASSCIAKVPSLIFDQALVVYDNGNGDFEVLLQTNIEGMRLSKRLWVGADAIAQAAERWREFAAEAGAVVVETKDCSYDAEADPVFRPRFGLLSKDFSYAAEAQAVVERLRRPCKMSEQSLLQECRQHFPSLAWDFDEGGECTAAFYGIDFYLCPEIDGSFSASILFNDNPLRWDWQERGFPSAASALAAASARWQEFAALAMTLVGPVPEPRPSPEHQRQSGMAITAYVMEGDRRKAQGLSPDRKAQARAGAEAMAWAEDNPPDSNQNQPHGEK